MGGFTSATLAEMRFREAFLNPGEREIREIVNLLGSLNRSTLDSLIRRVSQLENGNTTSGDGGGGTFSDGRGVSERILRSEKSTPVGVMNLPSVEQSSPGPISSPSNVVYLATTNHEIPLYSIVGVTRGRVARLASGTGAASDRIVPIGVVTGVVGSWAIIQTLGPASVRMDNETWSRNYYDGHRDEVWLSESKSGTASCRMPVTARNDIALIGHRIGPIRGGIAQIFVRPSVNIAFRWPVWEYDSDNYIDLEMIHGVRGQTVRLVFVVGGEVFAHLGESGRLFLRGSMTTLPYLVDTTTVAENSNNGEIEYDTGGNSEITFAVPDGAGNYVQVAEMLPSGVFQVGGYSSFSYPKSKATSGAMADFYEWNSSDSCLYFGMHVKRAYMGFYRYASPPSAVNASFQCNGVTADAFAY